MFFLSIEFILYLAKLIVNEFVEQKFASFDCGFRLEDLSLVDRAALF